MFVQVAPAESSGETPIRRSNLIRDELVSFPFANEPEVNTIVHCLERSAKTWPSNNLLGRRPVKDGKAGDFEWQSYDAVWKDVVNVGVGMRDMCKLESGTSGEGQARIGIYSMNRPENFKVLLGGFSQRICACPLYDTLGANAVGYIIGHAEVTCVATERAKLASLIASKKGASPLR